MLNDELGFLIEFTKNNISLTRRTSEKKDGEEKVNKFCNQSGSSRVCI